MEEHNTSTGRRNLEETMKKSERMVKIKEEYIVIDSEQFEDKKLQREFKVLEGRVREIEKAMKRIGIIIY